MFSNLLLRWPDQLPHPGQCADPLERAVIFLRRSEYLSAERLFLSLPIDVSAVFLVYLNYVRRRFASAIDILNTFSESVLASHSGSAVHLLVLIGAGLKCDHPIADQDQWCVESCDPLWAIALAHWALHSGDGTLLELILSEASIPDCPERVFLQARLYKAKGLLKKAINLLESAVSRAPQNLDLQQYFIALLLESEDFLSAIKALRSALEIHGESKFLMGHVATVKLLQRQPARSRRAALSHRLQSGMQTNQASITNLLIAYEQTGHSDWFNCLPAKLSLQQCDPNLLSNLAMQLASVESPMSADIATRFFDIIHDLNNRLGIVQSGYVPRLDRVDAELTIVWLSGDICDHPVGRFLLGFFSAVPKGEFRHRHVVVGWSSPLNNPFPGYFQDIQGVEYLDVYSLTPHLIVDRVRSLQPDVAVDLSGWTAKNFANGFFSRFAPLQVNYLGYFASTGNPSIDVWLGDHQLFPAVVKEWHSEIIHRLPRCFVAWSPPPQLPEADVPVAPPPDGGIRFGSFNHNRKFSDRALRLWAAILIEIPTSSLVLKASAPGDEATLELLKRRMQRCGLDPERVVWLPLAETNRDHLLQYAQIDIALDCLPNGGCTTTCEALWMGVPVITLTGSSYVSRMSTSVLYGAGMSEWCASSEEHYIKIAISNALNLSSLRAQRHSWRKRLMASQLGNARDLMDKLEEAFSQLYQRRCFEFEASR